MKEIIISKNEAGQRLNKYLMKYLNKAPSSFVYKMIRKKNIKLNGVKAEGNEIIYVGDTVQIYLSDETIGNFRDETVSPANEPKNKFKLEVIYHDENILIGNKPVGVLSQKADKGDYSFNEAMIDYLKENGEITEEQLATFKPSICNRLDRNTSGIILCGTSLMGSQELSRIIRERRIDKYYYTIVKGNLTETIEKESYLTKDKDTNKVSISENKVSLDSEFVHTIFEPVKSNGKYTYVKATLITGKTHQIRAQLSSLGYPIIGDQKYGDNQVNIYFREHYGLRNQLLHCGEIHFTKLKGGLKYMSDKSFSCFVPEKFKNITKDLFE